MELRPSGDDSGRFAREQDARVLDCIAALDISRFWDTIAPIASRCAASPHGPHDRIRPGARGDEGDGPEVRDERGRRAGAEIAVGYPGVIV